MISEKLANSQAGYEAIERVEELEWKVPRNLTASRSQRDALKSGKTF